MFDKLTKDERLLLLRFVCAFAWTDLQVKDGERKFIGRLMDRLGLSADERAEAEGFLHVAPPPESTNPKLVPRQHRQLFIDAVRALIYADGDVDVEERERLDKLRAAFDL